MTQLPASAQQALARLREGNRRFAGNLRSVDVMTSQARRDNLVGGQTPFAIILSCSDSRVPSEIIFDCGLGELFVVRVAGNIVAPSIVGSVEFAAAKFGTPLVVVMGHSQCGAVTATLAATNKENMPVSPNIRDIVERIAPAVHEFMQGDHTIDEALPDAIRANVRASVSHLRHGSKVLEQLITEGKLQVIGAEYALETGAVTFLDML